MKKIVSAIALSLVAATLSAQEQTDSMYISLSKGRVAKFAVSEIYSMGFKPVEVPEFPEVDKDAISLTYSPGWDGNKTQLSKNVYELLSRGGVEYANNLSDIQITDEHYDEIKAFTDELVKGLTTQKSIYNKCFSWITANIHYAQGSPASYPEGSGYSGGVKNDAYSVYKTHYAVCQGYSELLVVMLHSQGVPSCLVGGFIPEGGHAWCYVNCDGVWYVSDPTNGRDHIMSDYYKHASTFMPTILHLVLYKEDNFWYNYTESRLNVCRIEGEDEVLVVPYSIKGVKVSLLNPTYVSPNVKELFVGENIESFADIASGFVVGLRVNAPNLAYIHVDPDNKNFKSHEGVVYDKNNNSIVIVPAAMKGLTLLPVEKLEKSAVESVGGIEEIRIPMETKSIESYAISDCPNLKIAYVPEHVSVATNAFYKVHKDFKIVRY